MISLLICKIYLINIHKKIKRIYVYIYIIKLLYYIIILLNIYKEIKSFQPDYSYKTMTHTRK